MSMETRAVQDLIADIRYAVRALRRNPGFTLAATLVLGLGLGATTAVWSVVDTVLLSALPYPEPDRIVRIYQQNSETNLWTLSAVDIQAIAQQQKSFEAFGGARWSSAALSGTATPEQISIGKVQGGFFGAIGIPAVYGRVIDSTDERPGAPPVAVVSHALAERALGGAAQAVGKTLALDGVAHTVVGVLPAGRNGLAGITADAWSALQLGQPPRRGPFGFRGYARLKRGVTVEAAKRDLAGISERIFPLWAASFQDKNARLAPYLLRTTIVGNAGNALGYFAAAVLLVLLIAIANVGTLMLVRVSAREQELGVRGALGASRLRLGRLVLTECLVLGFLAAVAGLGFALAGLKVVQVAGPSLPRLAEVGFDWRAAAFLALTGCGAGLLVSLSPLLQVVRRSSQTSLAPDAARAGVSRAASRTRAGFVVAEFALAFPLLLGAGLLLKSFLRLQQVDPGFNPEGLGTVNIGLPSARYSSDSSRMEFWSRLSQRIEQAPGVVAVGLSTTMPPDNGGDVNNFDLLAHPVTPGTSQPVAPWAFVSNGYFAAMGIPLLEGRLFTPADTTQQAPVVVVSRAWASRYFPGEPVLGQQLLEGGCTTCAPTTVIGVVGDVHYLGLNTAPEGVYAPLIYAAPRGASLVFRSRGAPEGEFNAIRQQVAALDPELPFQGRTLREAVSESLSDPRRWTAILSSFASVSLFLAAIGIFGLMSFVVRQRRREIGIRMALGAEPGAVTRMIVVGGIRYALMGAGIGIVLSLIQLRWLRGLLFQVAPTDPMAMAVGAGILVGAGFLACWLPGLRAARIRPLDAIRSD